MEKDLKGFSTRALHSGWDHDPSTGSFGLPIYLTAGYKFGSAEEAASLFELKKEGFIYSRIGNPTVAAFEEVIADLESGSAAVATSSGQAAFNQLLSLICKKDDHVVLGRKVYGGTLTLLSNIFSKFGVEVSVVDTDDPEEVARAVSPKTRCIITETVGNPSLNIAPLEELATIARDNEALLIVDNTFMSPALCRPVEWGANVVVHSATKYLSGFGNIIGGVVVDGGNVNWGSMKKWPEFTEPEEAYHGVVFSEAFGTKALATKLRACALRDIGGCMSPFDAYLLWMSIGTLSLRMKKHSENALAVARFLEEREEVAWVSYPGLESHPHHERAKKYFREGYGGMIAFCLKGGIEAGRKFLNSLNLFSIIANIGDARSMAIHPASTTHSQLSREELEKAGIEDGLVRLSIGLEDVEDIIDDLDRALSSI
ncbi:MAG: O-acetylhomoserine aminocarboxypropyltransferase/cysteine synthase family protein [Acetomicrobium sp.]